MIGCRKEAQVLTAYTSKYFIGLFRKQSIAENHRVFALLGRVDKTGHHEPAGCSTGATRSSPMPNLQSSLSLRATAKALSRSDHSFDKEPPMITKADNSPIGHSIDGLATGGGLLEPRTLPTAAVCGGAMFDFESCENRLRRCGRMEYLITSL